MLFQNLWVGEQHWRLLTTINYRVYVSHSPPCRDLRLFVVSKSTHVMSSEMLLTRPQEREETRPKVPPREKRSRSIGKDKMAEPQKTKNLSRQQESTKSPAGTKVSKAFLKEGKLKRGFT